MTALLLILISHSPFQLWGKLRQTGTDPPPLLASELHQGFGHLDVPHGATKS